MCGVFLLLVRHAHPVRHETDGGVADPSLDVVGRDQARKLAGWLRSEQIAAIYSSPAARALETARPLERCLQLDAIVDKRFAEFDHGAPSYVPIEQLRDEGDVRWQRMERGELYNPDIDPIAFREAVVEAIEDVVHRHTGETVALFTHAGVVNAYVGHVLGIETPLWFAPRYTSVSRVAASRHGKRSVVSLNEACHLRLPPHDARR